jgi:ABC-type lipoprotein export system ATPase subunit
MTPTIHFQAFRLFWNEFKSRGDSWTLLSLSALCCVITDAVLPPCLAAILQRISSSAPYTGLDWPYWGFTAGIVALAPLVKRRLWLRGKLEWVGNSALTSKLNQALLHHRPHPRQPNSLAGGATSQLMQSWRAFVFAVTESFVWVLVGFISLTVLLWQRAPLMTAVFVLLLLIMGLHSLQTSRKLVKTGLAKSKEQAAMIALLEAAAANSPMSWIMRRLTMHRKQAAGRYRDTAHLHHRVTVQAHTVFQALHSSLKLCAIGLCAYISASHPEWTGTAFLIVWFSMTMSDRIGLMRSLVEDMANVAGQTGAVVVMLGQREETVKEALPQLESAVITFRQLSIEPAPGVTIRYPDWQFKSGQFNVITGPSGSGKSTLIEALAGTGHYTGSIRFGNQYELRNYDPGDSVVYARQAAVEVPLTIAGLFDEAVTPDQIHKALSYTGVSNLQPSRTIQSLSGGEQSRVLLAAQLRAATTTASAQIVLADEPTKGLDPDSMVQLLLGLQAHIAQHPQLIYIFTSHDALVKTAATALFEIPKPDV